MTELAVPPARTDIDVLAAERAAADFLAALGIDLDREELREVHDGARRAGARRHYRHLYDARYAARGPAIAGGIPGPRGRARLRR